MNSNCKEKIEKVLKKLIGTKNTYKIEDICFERRLNRKNAELYNLWKGNRKYINTHIGERCFILGNGPSLKEVDLSRLKEEFVFSVNNFGFVDNFLQAQPNVHLWIDDSFFGLRDDQKYNMEKVMEGYRIMSQANPICFFPYNAYEFVKVNHLDDFLNVNYIVARKSILDDIIDDFSIDSTIYYGTTVVQYAIQIAISMGFREIYLLGCDTTNIVTVLNTAMEKSNSEMHAYDNDDTEEIYKNMLKKVSMTYMFYDQYILFLGYSKWSDYCKNRTIKLINCTSKTLINDIDRKNLDEVLLKTK